VHLHSQEKTALNKNIGTILNRNAYVRPGQDSWGQRRDTKTTIPIGASCRPSNALRS
jgi:hypothetical protein